MAVVKDLAVLAETHEPIACSASTITSRTEAGNMIVVHQPANDFVKRTLIRDVKLLGIVRALRLVVTTDTRARAA